VACVVPLALLFPVEQNSDGGNVVEQLSGWQDPQVATGVDSSISVPESKENISSCGTFRLNLFYLHPMEFQLLVGRRIVNGRMVDRWIECPAQAFDCDTGWVFFHRIDHWVF
jgi:hypothetical protein